MGGFFNELGATPEKVFIILIEAFIAGWLPSGLPDVSVFTMVETNYNVLVHFSFPDRIFSKRCQTWRQHLQKLEGHIYSEQYANDDEGGYYKSFAQGSLDYQAMAT